MSRFASTCINSKKCNLFIYLLFKIFILNLSKLLREICLNFLHSSIWTNSKKNLPLSTWAFDSSRYIRFGNFDIIWSFIRTLNISTYSIKIVRNASMIQSIISGSWILNLKIDSHDFNQSFPFVYDVHEYLWKIE